MIMSPNPRSRSFLFSPAQKNLILTLIDMLFVINLYGRAAYAVLGNLIDWIVHVHHRSSIEKKKKKNPIAAWLNDVYETM